MGDAKKHIKGLTLVELIVSIAIIGVIAIAFIPIFGMTARINNRSEVVLDSTYMGKDIMELIYKWSQEEEYENLESKLIDAGYTKDTEDGTFGYEHDDKRYSNIRFSEEGNLLRVIIKIYRDKSVQQLEAQYESLFSWKGRGILGEEE